MPTIELNIDMYESMLKELGVLKSENEELKNRLQTSHNSKSMPCRCETPSPVARECAECGGEFDEQSNV